MTSEKMHAETNIKKQAKLDSLKESITKKNLFLRPLLTSLRVHYFDYVATS